MLGSVRRQGLRGDILLKDSDNLLQRYRNLQAKLQHLAEVQRALEEACTGFDTQTESTRSWVRKQQQKLHSLGNQAKIDKRIHTSQVSLQGLIESERKYVDQR